jgi:isochorismate hydrolase
MVSDFTFPDGERLLAPALRAARRIATLKQRAARQGVPCIYVNDNAGRWSEDRNALISHCLAQPCKAAEIVRLVEPNTEDFFILKPRHSGFFASPLHTLLNQLNTSRLIITGVTTHQCVLFTAVDAHMREFELVVPRDCVASMSISHHRNALALMEVSLNANTAMSSAVRFIKPKRQRGIAAAS